MESTTDILIKILKEKFEIKQELYPDTLLEEIGLDSMDMIHFLFSLDQMTGVDIQDEVFVSEDSITIAYLASYIDKRKK